MNKISGGKIKEVRVNEDNVEIEIKTGELITIQFEYLRDYNKIIWKSQLTSTNEIWD